jgi:hypothetical protein
MRSRSARTLVALALVAGLAVATGDGSAQAPSVPPRDASSDSAGPGAGLQVFLMTMGPGARIEERFGHNAIWIRDSVSGQDLIYNFGMFDWEAPNFTWNFAMGRPEYWLDAWDLDLTMRVYDRAQRQVEIQELALPDAVKADLAARLAQNALPANRAYRYDYFLDNCSTRVRDVLDAVLGGALRRHTEGVAAEGTYRWHTQRSISNNPWLYLGILAGQGMRVDAPLDQWGEMFLPAKLQERVRELRVTDALGRDVPLVRREATILPHSTHSVEPTRPDWTWPLLGIGAALALLIGSGALRGVAGAAGRATAIAWSVLLGVGGVVLAFLWFVTDHVFSGNNLNLLLFTPLAFALTWMLVRGTPGGTTERGAGPLAVFAVASVLVGGVLGLFNAEQQNRELAALMLLPSLAAFVLAVVLSRRRAAALPGPR